MPRVLAALSGGVDSSVALKLLKDKGYDVAGAIMRFTDGDDFKDSIKSAETLCRRLSCDFHIMDCRKEFESKVIDEFASYYLNGKTPNPCVQCNRLMKFGKFLEFADSLGCDFIATGHYAVNERQKNGCVLKKGADISRDQSYFLYHLTQKQLQRIVFPLGNMKKSEIRRIARECGFENAEAPESQDICFVHGCSYADIVKKRFPDRIRKGFFRDMSGRIIKENDGIFRWTVGQRRGTGIAMNRPVYVVKVDASDNSVYIGDKQDLLKSRLTVPVCSWVSGKPAAPEFDCKARIRYLHREADAHVVCRSGGAEVCFSEKQSAITPGQHCVLYDGDVVLGGGEIAEVLD